MDSNVSKNTFSHKFFKLGLNQQNQPIALQYLLTQSLLSALDLYQQKTSFSLGDCRGSAMERDGIVALQLDNHNHQVLFASIGFPIVYSSPLALFLAPEVQQPPKIIARELADLLVLLGQNLKVESEFNLLNIKVTVEQSGWLTFSLESMSIANWLQQSLRWLKTRAKIPAYSSQVFPLPNIAPNLFPVQYIHARCCCLLNLATREGLIVFPEDKEQTLTAWLLSSELPSWWDDGLKLWWQTPAEEELLRQLFAVIDSYFAPTSKTNWGKRALNLSETVAVFCRECRLLGKIAQESPQLALARWRLLALAQIWLAIILVEKLNIIAVTRL